MGAITQLKHYTCIPLHHYNGVEKAGATTPMRGTWHDLPAKLDAINNAAYSYIQ